MLHPIWSELTIKYPKKYNGVAVSKDMKFTVGADTMAVIFDGNHNGDSFDKLLRMGQYDNSGNLVKPGLGYDR